MPRPGLCPKPPRLVDPPVARLARKGGAHGPTRQTPATIGSCCAFPEQVPHVGDVILRYRRREHCSGSLVTGALLRKALTAACDSQRSKMLTRAVYGTEGVRFES